MPQKYHYLKSELEDSLRRAFANEEADYILVDGNTIRNEFLREGLHLAQSEGWLDNGEETGDEQYTAFKYRLTDKGKEHFGLD
jgi:hypothetical protein